MSYQPPSDQPPQEGTPTTNVSSPGSGGAYTQPTGDYTPPPPAGGYTPPPSVGGYTPPPGGGYSAPPPPPTGMGGGGGMGSMGGGGGAGGQLNPQELIQSYIGAVTKPNAAFYESEMPKASWVKTIVGTLAVAVVQIIFGLLFAGAAAAQLNSLRDQLNAQGRTLPFDIGILAGASGAGSILAIVLTPLFFLLGSGLLYLVAKMLGGQGNDFMTHSYLLSLSYTPIRILTTVLNIIPLLGGLVSFVLGLYLLYCQGKSMEASQRLSPGRAQLAAFLPTIIGIVLAVLCCILVFVGLLGVVGNANR